MFHVVIGPLLIRISLAVSDRLTVPQSCTATNVCVQCAVCEMERLLLSWSHATHYTFALPSNLPLLSVVYMHPATLFSFQVDVRHVLALRTTTFSTMYSVAASLHAREFSPRDTEGTFRRGNPDAPLDYQTKHHDDCNHCPANDVVVARSTQGADEEARTYCGRGDRHADDKEVCR